MKSYILEPTKKTMSVKIDFENFLVELSGYSVIPCPKTTYSEFIENFEKLKIEAKNHSQKIIVNCFFTYYSGIFSRFLLEFFRNCENFTLEGGKVMINWFFEEDEEDMLICGEDYKNILKLNFTLTEVKNI